MTLFEHMNTLSVGVGLLVAVAVVIKNLLAGQKNSLEDILVRVFAGAMLPTGILLVFCAFKPTLISHLENLNIHIAVAGIALIFISVSSLFSRSKN